MNILSLALKAFIRDWRSGELRLIALAIIIAVASLTAVNFFTDRVRRATEQQATELLAADLVLRSREPIPEVIKNSALSNDLIITNITSLSSMVVAGEKLQMAEVKAVESDYPIRGKLRTSNRLFNDEVVTDEIPEPGTVWLDNRLFQILDIEIGSTVKLGSSEFTVTKLITYEPDRGGDMFNIAPRLMMNLADIEATDLILPASRVTYYLLLGGDITTIDQFRQGIENTGNIRIQGIRDARPELRSALERAEQFLGLAALVSVALAGLAVAMSAQRYVTRHFDNCAIMRCLGADQTTISSIYFLQLLILSTISSLLGCAIGYFAQNLMTSMMAGMTNGELPGPSIIPVFIGLGAGIITVLGFAMPQILRLRTVSPLRVLRRDLTPLPLRGITSYATAIIALALLTPWQSGNILLTFWSFFGILLTAAVLMFFSTLLVRFLSRLRSRVGVSYRFGLANVARRSNSSIAQILGIGLGVMVMLLLTLVRTDLLDNWRDRLPEGTPNFFLINIQSSDVTELKSFLQKNGNTTAELYPMVRARLSAINGRKVDPDNFGNREARRWARRGYNLTWSNDLPEGNRIIEGEWWTNSDNHEHLFSLEEEIPRELGVKLNDTLTFSIAGREVTGKISNIRNTEWDSFNVNFFVAANPGTLEDFPSSYITSFYLPTENKDIIIDLVKAFPSITVIDADALITEVRRIMNQVILTIEFVFAFTLMAGIIVLIAALQTTHDERTYESALLSTIGANRRQILASLTAEFLCIGLIAGILSAFCATIVEIILAEFVFNMDIVINFWIWIIAPIICTLVIVTCGLAGTRKVLYTPPIVALRDN